MALQVAAAISSLRSILLDAAAVTFSDTELVTWLNEGVRSTCFAKPDAYTVETDVSLVAGIVQTLPDGAIALLDVVKNTATGVFITQVDKALLEAADPNWGALTPQVSIDHFTADARNPRRFLVYPPAALGARATVLYGATPDALSATTDVIALPDAYEPCLIDYVLSRAYAKNSKKQDLSKSAAFKQSWGAALGLKSQAQVAASPRITPGTPT